MATTLSFTQNSSNRWEASCTSSGDRIAVEITRTKSGPLIVYGNITGLGKKMIHDFGPSAEDTVIFEIDVPADIDITIESFTEVTSAKIVGA